MVQYLFILLFFALGTILLRDGVKGIKAKKKVPLAVISIIFGIVFSGLFILGVIASLRAIL